MLYNLWCHSLCTSLWCQIEELDGHLVVTSNTKTICNIHTYIQHTYKNLHYFTRYKFTISQYEAVYSVLKWCNIKSLTWYGNKIMITWLNLGAVNTHCNFLQHFRGINIRLILSDQNMSHGWTWIPWYGTKA